MPLSNARSMHFGKKTPKWNFLKHICLKRHNCAINSTHVFPNIQKFPIKHYTLDNPFKSYICSMSFPVSLNSNKHLQCSSQSEFLMCMRRTLGTPLRRNKWTTGDGRKSMKKKAIEMTSHR